MMSVCVWLYSYSCDVAGVVLGVYLTLHGSALRGSWRVSRALTVCVLLTCAGSSCLLNRRCNGMGGAARKYVVV